MPESSQMSKLRVAVVGGSGYAGGELLRLLFCHPLVEIGEVSSERFAGKPISSLHPNLRHLTQKKFVDVGSINESDLVFLCLPHGQTASRFDEFAGLGSRVVDLSADFRLHNLKNYETFYGTAHPRPEMVERFVPGIAELHRERLRDAKFVSCAGCNATVSLLSLWPLFRAGVVHPTRTVIDVKVGSSEGGSRESASSHHPERSGCVRSFKPTGHRHMAEIEEQLSLGNDVLVHFSVTAVEMVRGALATSHVFLSEPLTERDIWQIYREQYGKEPFVRIVKNRQGIHRYPEPKLLSGTNFFDVGFERDTRSERLVVIGAIDNLMKGAAGQAVQAMNLMCGFDERTGLEFPGLHPV